MITFVQKRAKQVCEQLKSEYFTQVFVETVIYSRIEKTYSASQQGVQLLCIRI